MNFNQLTYFDTVVKYGSINKAAQQLYTTPSTIATALNSLEKELGYKIIDRDHNGINITAQGKDFLKDVQVVLSFYEKWQNPLSPYLTEKTPVNFYVVPAIFHSVSNRLATEISSQFPNLYFASHLTFMKDFDRILQENAPNLIAIRPCNTGEEHALKILLDNLNMQMQHLYDDCYYTYVNAAHPLAQQTTVTTEQVAQYPCVHLADESLLRYHYHKFMMEHASLYFHHISDVLYFLTQHKNHYSFLPGLVNNHYFCQEQKLIRLPMEDASFPVSYYLIYPNDSQMTETEAIAKDFIAEFFQHINI